MHAIDSFTYGSYRSNNLPISLLKLCICFVISITCVKCSENVLLFYKYFTNDRSIIMTLITKCLFAFQQMEMSAAFFGHTLQKKLRDVCPAQFVLLSLVEKEKITITIECVFFSTDKRHYPSYQFSRIFNCPVISKERQGSNDIVLLNQ